MRNQYTKVINGRIDKDRYFSSYPGLHNNYILLLRVGLIISKPDLVGGGGGGDKLEAMAKEVKLSMAKGVKAERIF